MQEHEMKAIEFELAEASREAIELLLDDPDDGRIFWEVFEANQTSAETLKLLYEHADTPDELREKVSGLLHMPVPVNTKAVVVHKAKEQESGEQKEERLTGKIKKLTVGEKIRVSMRAGKEVRNLLLKDSNKQVVLGVLGNPKITIPEVEAAARSRSLPDEALRSISRNREWMKNYGVLYSLVTNAKTPAGIAMGYLPSLKPRDLQLLQKNKNVPDALRAGARKLVAARKKNG
ncbi:MAG: hypothetical protein M0Z59_03305 [Nitrospiraceae bacterium]|nr:hypothetical protein [Nitrospiraceae bacterium]